MDPEEAMEADYERRQQRCLNARADELASRSIRKDDMLTEFHYGRAEHVYREASIYNEPGFVEWLLFDES